MAVRILIGDVREQLKTLADESVDCVVTSPPYWGLRDYGVVGQLGLERSLGEHLDVMVEVFSLVRRVMKPEASLWLNYGDCYATSPNGRSAADTKAAAMDDRTFRDKPFSTIGAVYVPGYEKTMRAGVTENMGNVAAQHGGRIVGGAGVLKPKDLCMVANRLAIALQDDGWWVRAENVWGKPNPMPDSSGRYRPSTAHEKVWLLTKSAKSFYDSEAVRMAPEESTVQRLAQNVEAQAGSDRANAGGKTNGPMKAVGRVSDKQRGHSRRHQGFNDRWDQMERDEQIANGRLLRNYEPAPWDHIGFCGEVWNIAPVGFSEAHFATFPPALVEPCIAAGCPTGGTVLDPFFGAGTTGLVADRMGRDCIGIELNPAYAEIARKRITGDCPMFSEVA